MTTDSKHLFHIWWPSSLFMDRVHYFPAYISLTAMYTHHIAIVLITCYNIFHNKGLPILLYAATAAQWINLCDHAKTPLHTS